MDSSNERGKVVEALEHCKHREASDGCQDCPWIGPECGIDVAISMLKAQEPKVLALNEIHRGMAVWLEDVDKADVILAIGGSSVGGAKCFITENDMSITPKDTEYGIRWRAWTAEPTEEQRKGVKWGA